MAVLRHSNSTRSEVEGKKRKRRSGKEKYEGAIMVHLKIRGGNWILSVGIVKICWWKGKKKKELFWFRNKNSLMIWWKMLEDTEANKWCYNTEDKIRNFTKRQLEILFKGIKPKPSNYYNISSMISVLSLQIFSDWSEKGSGWISTIINLCNLQISSSLVNSDYWYMS